MLKLVSVLLCQVLPWTLFLSVAVRLIYWIYFTLLAPAESADLTPFGGRNRRSWCLITGATDGIGLALAKELARHKFNLFLVGRNSEKLEAVKRDILNEQPTIKIVGIISEASDAKLSNVSALMNKVKETLATEKGILRMLINNVGIGWGRKCRVGDIEEDEVEKIEEIVAVNCSFPVLLTREVLKHLRQAAAEYNNNSSERFAMVNLASCSGLTPATPFSALYSATKAFNRSFSNSLAGEIEARRILHPERPMPRIQVLCVNPGFVTSNMTGMRESFICCSARAHAQVVLRKLASWPPGLAADIIPHWKHGLMWAALTAIEWIVAWDWLLVAVIMPQVFKFSGRFRNFKID